MNNDLPIFYLEGNVSLQETIESFHKNCIRKTLEWLATSVVFFLLLLIGVTLESHFLAVFSILELIVCSVAVYLMQDIPADFQ